MGKGGRAGMGKWEWEWESGNGKGKVGGRDRELGIGDQEPRSAGLMPMSKDALKQ